MSEKDTLRRRLREAGFRPTLLSRHERWDHPTGVRTLVHLGSRLSESRLVATVRSAIRRARKLEEQG